jgi:hypothetical protein
MNPFELQLTALTHVIFATARRVNPSALADHDDPDRGAVSIEQVLWYAAAAISVAVISAIIWAQIRDQAETPVNAPTAP